MEAFPLPGYIPIESHLPGIEVYMPAPADEEIHQEVVDFKCPQCGAVTAYSVAEGGLKCTHCGFYEPPKQSLVGHAAQQFEFTLDTLERAAPGWGEARNELGCQNCGALTSISSTVLTVTCPFCGSNQVIQRAAPQDTLRPRFLVPFQVQPDACRQLAAQFLSGSWMTPGSLAHIARQAAFVPIYLPFWTFDSTTDAEWRAEVGHEEVERYYDAADKEWKSRTRIVWRWESGRVRLPFDDLLIPGSERLSPVLLGRIKGFDLRALVAYDPKFLAGMSAQGFDVPLEIAWELARQQMRAASRRACLNQASTPRVRNFSMNLGFSAESWRYILLPLYLAVYRFENQVYQVVINGQTGEISGQRPVDWRKVWLVILGLLAPGVLLGLAGLISVPLAGVGAGLGIIGFALLVVGLVVGGIIFAKAQGLDDA
jgi:predicted RNA-binding Zn-ribbon protein involved in translation (DUF1610 family)